MTRRLAGDRSARPVRLDPAAPWQSEAPFAVRRRDFLRLASAGTALSVLGLPIAEAWAKGFKRAEPLKVGVVGCGGRGTGAAIQALRADPGTILWSMGDTFAERLEGSLGHISGAMGSLDEQESGGDWSRKVQVDESRRFIGLGAYKKVIDSGVDVVILTTPPGFRPQHLAAAVDANKHVFCEKPVAVDGTGVRSVLDTVERARAKSLSIMSGFCWRYSRRERETYAQIHSGRMGEIQSVYTTYNTTGWIEPKPRRSGWSDGEFQVRNWHYFTPLSGDHIVEQAVHAIDKLRWGFNDEAPLACVAVGGREVRPEAPETGNVWDHFSVAFEYSNGRRGHHMCRHWPNAISDNSDYLLGTKGRAEVNGWTDTHVIEGASPWRCESPRNDMYQQEHDELFAAIRAKTPINDGVAMTHSTLMAIMAREAAYTGQQVSWEQALNSSLDLNAQPWDWSDRPTPPTARPGVTKLI